MQRVLVVDDDPRVRAALTALLEGTADFVVTASVASAAQARVALAAHSVDTVIVDVHLPRRADGIALIAALSAGHRVVALSIDGTSRNLALAAGATDYVEKTGSPEDILRVLRATS
ncbi:response regulator transcription factor [Planosporangium thailandense]|uniref:Response regulator transcription factor n=1 Tax=Planosporangium thailandense TaxID=765197 RepID=A0ABX0XT09_9ACTN|nr:response regulator [Planosporangium thailandense]NJC69141.1 response regulator transcription factor [Planosporangium thailandense]